MATVTITEAAYMSEPTPACGVLLSRRVHDQLFGKIPFVYIDGHQLDIANADADGLRAHASVIGTTGASPAKSLPLLELATIPLAHFATILEVDSLLLSRYGNRQDLLRALLDVKVASLLDLFRYTIVNGDSAVAGEFDGLLKLADTFLTQTRANGGAGGAVQAGEIERMLSILRPQHGFANRYLVMHSEAFKHLRAGAYQNDVFFTQDATLGLLPTIGGAKVLIDNHLPLTEGPSTDWTSILGVVLEARSGVHGALPCVRRGAEVEVLGPVARESTETLTLALQMPAGVGAGNKGAIAKLDGVQYTDVEYVRHALLGTIPSIAGVPILYDNFIPVTETRGTSNDTTSIYAVLLGEEDGLCGIYPSSAVGQPIQVRGPVVKESTDTMWFHVSWDVSLACFNKGAVARLYGVKYTN